MFRLGCFRHYNTHLALPFLSVFQIAATFVKALIHVTQQLNVHCIPVQIHQIYKKNAKTSLFQWCVNGHVGPQVCFWSYFTLTLTHRVPQQAFFCCHSIFLQMASRCSACYEIRMLNLCFPLHPWPESTKSQQPGACDLFKNGKKHG